MDVRGCVIPIGQVMWTSVAEALAAQCYKKVKMEREKIKVNVCNKNLKKKTFKKNK